MSGSAPPAPPPPPPGFPGQTPPFIPPVPPPWTEHRAPGGQPYWFNPITNVSTYVRPLPIPMSAVPPPLAAPPLHFPSGPTPQPTMPTVTKKEKKEKPKIKKQIEGTDWIEVTTNKGNVFWSHRETKASVWTMPDEVKRVVEQEKHQEREREKDLVEAESRKRKAEVVEEQDVKDEEGKAQEEDEEAEGADESIVVGEGQPTAQENGAVEVKSVSSPAATTADSAPLAKKKKKAKVVVVHDIEEMEQDEDWQRQIAEEMAKEAEELEQQRQQQQKQLENEVDEVGRSIRPGGRAAKGGASAPLGGMDVSSEEGAALFKAMLGEKEINPMAPWDMELPKFINDPRYLAVKQLKDRRDLFEEFCKEKLREIRAAKKKAAEEGSLPQIDPLTAYRELLQTAVTSTRTHYSDFKRQHHKDVRFRNFGKTEGEKEKVFKQWLRELGEKKRAEANKAEQAFKTMLSEDKSINAGDKWSEVKARFTSDPRYAAVPSSSQREGLFEAYCKALAGGSNDVADAASTATAKRSLSKEERAARAAASLREREEQVRGEKERAARQARAARGQLGREEGEREFGTLLVDQVRDHTARWEDVLSALSKDPRFTDSPLSIHDQRRLFEVHLKSLFDKRLAVVEGLFAQHAPGLTTRFETILPSIADSPHVVRLVGKDLNRLERLYDSWLRKWTETARRDFDQLLKESPILEHWGRLAKQEDKDNVKVMGEEGAQDSDDDDEMPSLVEMAKQIDLPAIHKVLKHDKRYLIFDHVPEQRNEWIDEYLRTLSAPKQTVHQKE